MRLAQTGDLKVVKIMIISAEIKPNFWNMFVINKIICFMSTFIMIFKMFEVIASLQCLVKSMCFNKMATVHCGSEGISAFMLALRIFSFATLGILSLAAL